MLIRRRQRTRLRGALGQTRLSRLFSACAVDRSQRIGRAGLACAGSRSRRHRTLRKVEIPRTEVTRKSQAGAHSPGSLTLCLRADLKSPRPRLIDRLRLRHGKGASCHEQDAASLCSRRPPCAPGPRLRSNRREQMLQRGLRRRSPRRRSQSHQGGVGATPASGALSCRHRCDWGCAGRRRIRSGSELLPLFSSPSSAQRAEPQFQVSRSRGRPRPSVRRTDRTVGLPTPPPPLW
jgi:hypothetical protein